MDQKAQIIEAIQACQQSDDFLGIGKILKKFPEAGAYRLPTGTSIYLDCLLKGLFAPLMIGIANGFDPKNSLCEGGGRNTSVIDTLLHQMKTKEDRRIQVLMALGALPEVASHVSADALISAIDIDASTEKWDIFPKISSSLSSLSDEQIGRVFSSFMSKEKDPLPGIAEGLLKNIDDNTILLGNTAFREANQVSLIEAAIVRRKVGLTYAFLGRSALRAAIEGVDFVALARECNWSQKDVAQLESFVINKIVDDTSVAATSDCELEVGGSGEPKHAIRRKSMF